MAVYEKIEALQITQLKTHLTTSSNYEKLHTKI
jgi:hypothetical protein